MASIKIILRIEGDPEPIETTLESFIEDNDMTNEEALAMALELHTTGTYQGDEGAGGTFTIERA